MSEKEYKLLAQLDLLNSFFKKALLFSVFALMAALLWGSISRAASIPDTFLVPFVRLTPIGAVVLQPQTGDGYNMLFTRNRTVASGGTGGALNPQTDPVIESGQVSDFEGGQNFVPPQYDAFAPGSAGDKLPKELPVIRSVDQVDILVSNNLPGSTDQRLGTTGTTFSFTGDISSKDFSQGEMEYRWDLDGDGQMDSYFSHSRTITHRYTTAGQYTLMLQVLDSRGSVSSTTTTITIVNNDPPHALFSVNANSAPINSIIRFDTSFSTDNQFTARELMYRFDFDGDGNYETNFQKKPTWNHLFREANTYHVIMEAMDPEGLTSRAAIYINILDDNPPTASLSIERLNDFRYQFDASHSSDDFTPANELLYRWDLDFGGTEDIVFDTAWSRSAKLAGTYKLGGSKTVRLQVKDKQGFIAESYAQIDVPWTEDYLNMAVELL